MIFLIQFVRFRRGARVVIHTVTVEAGSGRAALALARNRIGTRFWPVNTDALRVMDDGGRTVLDWNVPTPDAQLSPSSPHSTPKAQIKVEMLPAHRSLPGNVTEAVGSAPSGYPHWEVGRAISYAEDGKPEIWKGGYQIVGEPEPNASESQYTIRSADEPHDRVVKEHELREDLGARTRGQ